MLTDISVMLMSYQRANDERHIDPLSDPSILTTPNSIAHKINKHQAIQAGIDWVGKTQQSKYFYSG